MKRNFFFTLLIFITSFLIFELVLNISNIRPSNKNYGWLNAHKTYSNLLNKIELNEFGTRDTFLKNKEKNIILLGDSQIELAQEKFKMPARILESELPEFNVYSFGSWGWGNDQQLLILKKYIKKLNPEYVILFFTINDINDNFHNIGFLGEKPTFKVENKTKLIDPPNFNVKKYLNYLWSYRTLYRLYLHFKNRNLDSFETEIYFNERENCNEDQNTTINLLLESVRDYESFSEQRIAVAKNNQKIESKKYIDNLFYQFLEKRNNYEKPTDQKVDYFRDKQTSLEDSKIILTNLLLNRIQSITQKNKSKFVLINVTNKHFLFKDNEEYSICYKGKTIKYSNENYFQLLNQVFNNIDNIFEYEISRNKKWYDDKDGHNNYEINKGIFKKLSKYILELN